MTVNEKIVALLSYMGVSQTELAERTGIPRANISAYVTGRAAVSVEMAYKIAKGLGVTPWTVLNCEPFPISSLELTKGEEELITQFRSLTDQQRELIEKGVALMVRQNSETK